MLEELATMGEGGQAVGICCKMCQKVTFRHSWTSASRSMPPASASTRCHRHSHLASYISVRYRSIPAPDWVPLFRYRTGSGIGFFVHSGAGLTGCRTVRHSGNKNTVVGGGERDIQCTSQLQVVESDTHCTFKDSS
jgi:hypothetical protein